MFPHYSKLLLTVRRTKERAKRDKTFLFEFENGHVMVEKPDGPPPAPQPGNGQQPKKIGKFTMNYSMNCQQKTCIPGCGLCKTQAV